MREGGGEGRGEEERGGWCPLHGKKTGGEAGGELKLYWKWVLVSLKASTQDEDSVNGKAGGEVGRRSEALSLMGRERVLGAFFMYSLNS